MLQVQLSWADHVTRMEDILMPKAVFFSELQEGKRNCSAPRKRYKDKLKRQLALRESTISHSSRYAKDRDNWRSSVRKACRKFEAKRHEAEKERRRWQKERAASQSSSAQTFARPKGTRIYATRIKLYSDKQACKN